jgi:hypothetical protein
VAKDQASRGPCPSTLDPHTHEITLTIMAGAVAIVAQQFRVLDLTRVKKSIARVGLWISVANPALYGTAVLDFLLDH